MLEDTNTLLVKSEELQQRYHAIGKSVVVNTRKRIAGALDSLIAPGNLTYETVQKPGKIIGGTRNIYRYHVATSKLPWAKIEQHEIIQLTYAVKLEDGTIKLVRADEVVFVYDDSIWLSSSKPSAPASAKHKPESSKGVRKVKVTASKK